jgi:hypothetical protein
VEGDQRKSRIEELCKLYSSQNNISIIKPGGIGWARHVASMTEKKIHNHVVWNA